MARSSWKQASLDKGRDWARSFRRVWYRHRWSRQVRRFRGIRALRPGGQPFTVLSMVQHSDVCAYLAAVASFCRQADPQSVVVVADPSLTCEDRQDILRAIAHVEFLEALAFQDPKLPTGGTWERLQAMVALSAQGRYVVQLDADTLTLEPVPEVLEAVLKGSAFTMSDRHRHPRMNHSQASELARPWQHHRVHIQGLCEFLLPQARLPGPWYVRGCSGFFGLPPDRQAHDRMMEFALAMQALVGPRWHEWGTEQVTANYVAANSSRFVLLPWPRYGTPATGLQDVCLAHFMGSVRHETPWYRQALARVAHLHDAH